MVGLPGDVVAMRRGVLFIDGKVQQEPYVSPRGNDGTTYGPLEIPAGHFFVLGDNRAVSTDSRSAGPVPEADLIGRVLVRIWPLTRAGAL